MSQYRSSLLYATFLHYRETLLAESVAREWLQRRGLTDLPEDLCLGYANRTLTKTLLPEGPHERKALQDELRDLGILRRTGHEHFNGCLVIPIFDDQGRIVNAYGRKLNDRIRDDLQYHLTLNHRTDWVFGLSRIPEQSPEVLVAKSALDALTAIADGFETTIALPAELPLDENVVRILVERGCKRVMLDPANASHEEAFKAAGFEVYHLIYSSDHDLNSYLRDLNNPDQALGTLIRNASFETGGQDLELEPETIRSLPDTEWELFARLEGEAEEEDWEEVEGDLPALPIQRSAPTQDLPELVEDGRALRVSIEHRQYRILGFDHRQGPERMKVNLRVDYRGAFHVDMTDLYLSPQRSKYAREASLELRITEDAIKKDLGRILHALEHYQERLAREAGTSQEPPETLMSPEQRQQAMDLLRSTNLISRLRADIGELGLVGESDTAIVAYLAATSRLLSDPISVLFQALSAEGKSTLKSQILSLMPPEARVSMDSISRQALFYFGENELSHRILALEEEAGMEEAAYALKVLQSEGKLSKAVAGMGSAGQTGTSMYTVNGPVSFFLTTTSSSLDDELVNRCLVLTVDGSREQTAAIHKRQRLNDTLEGLRAKARAEAVRTLHRNAQRLLRPLYVVNPYAEQLTFRSDTARTRRDQPKYLALIRAISLLHQHQRTVKTFEVNGEEVEYIETTVADIRLANKLAESVMGCSLDDLPTQPRRLLGVINAWDRDRSQTFTRRDLREHCRWQDTRLKEALKTLADMEFLTIRHGGGNQPYEYALPHGFRMEQDEASSLGLRDPDELMAYETPEEEVDTGKEDGQPGIEELFGKVIEFPSGRRSLYLDGGRRSGQAVVMEVSAVNWSSYISEINHIPAREPIRSLEA